LEKQNKMNDRYMELVKDEHKLAYTQYVNHNLREYPYASHQPVLIHLINTITEGDVLEIGIGYHSTPILNLICGKQKRNVLSIETDEGWVRWFEEFRNKRHDIQYISRDELIKLKNPLFEKKYSIALIDGAVAKDRQVFIEAVKADYIIVHDTDCVVNKTVNDFNYNFSIFKHVHHFVSATPMTSVLSNLDRIDKDILTIFW
jgi:hypothetical protein